MRRPRLRHGTGPLLSLFDACLLVSGCSSSTDERAPITSTKEDYCQQVCRKAHTCDDTTELAECRSSCEASLDAAPELRTDFLGYVAGCIESSSCSITAISKCKSEAFAQLATSRYGQSLCPALATARETCADTASPYPAENCLTAVKSYDDEALKAANDCLAEPCSTLDTCLTQAIPAVNPPH